MRAIPLVLLFMLFLGSACNAAPAGPIPPKLAEDLQQSHSISAIKTFLLNIRARILRSKTTERWIRTFATATPSTTATATSSAAAKAFRVPDEDALVRYRYVGGRASTDDIPAGTARDVIGGKTQVQLWTKARKMQTKSRNSVDLPSSLQINRPRGGERISTTADSMSLWNGMSPRIQRLPNTASPRLQRGKELEIMPLAPSPRARKMLDVVERRKSTSIAESSSMAKMRSYKSAFVRADAKLPIRTELERSESDRDMHYPTG